MTCNLYGYISMRPRQFELGIVSASSVRLQEEQSRERL